MPPRAKPRTPSSAPSFLVFRHGYTTTALLTKLLTPFPELITEFLSALSSRYPHGIPASTSPTSSLSKDDLIQIPTDPHCVRLALPVDPAEPKKGYKEIPWVRYEENVLKNSPAAWGLEEGGVLAFCFTETPIDGEEQEEGLEVVRREDGGFWIESPAQHVKMTDQQLRLKAEDAGDAGETAVEREGDGDEDEEMSGAELEEDDSEMEREVARAMKGMGDRVR